jgi:hypothetical protein
VLEVVVAIVREAILQQLLATGFRDIILLLATHGGKGRGGRDVCVG